MMDVEKLRDELREKFQFYDEGYDDETSSYYTDWDLLATHVNRLVIEARIEELNDLDIFYSTSFAGGKRIEERIAELKEQLG